VGGFVCDCECERECACECECLRACECVCQWECVCEGVGLHVIVCVRVCVSVCEFYCPVLTAEHTLTISVEQNVDRTVGQRWEEESAIRLHKLYNAELHISILHQLFVAVL
jgi:hypothetical protein